MTELTTGAQRAAERENKRALELEDKYKDTTFKGNTRASKRRLAKALKKHEENMALRQRRRYA